MKISEIKRNIKGMSMLMKIVPLLIIIVLLLQFVFVLAEDSDNEDVLRLAIVEEDPGIDEVVDGIQIVEEMTDETIDEGINETITEEIETSEMSEINELIETDEINEAIELNESNEVTEADEKEQKEGLTEAEGLNEIDELNTTKVIPNKKRIRLLMEIRDSKKNGLGTEIKILDKKGRLIKRLSKQKMGKADTEKLEEITATEEIEEGVYEVEVMPEEGPVEKIHFNEVEITQNDSLLIGIDYVPEERITEKEFVKVYAIDPTGIDFIDATVTVTAKGTELYKCKDWRFEEQRCYGDWELFKTGLVPGEQYEFILTPDDPGFGEIIATAADHLDSDYNFISNIFEEVKKKDDVWSEAIYEGAIVRVTFEEKLTDGRMIDVYVRSNQTMAYFDIYEAGTDHKVGRSGIIEYPGLEFIPVNGLTEPTDAFDFKIVKVYLDKEDNSTNIDPNTNSFLEFDYIHDDVINSTYAAGLIAYSELNVETPRYRTWDASNDFGAEASAPTVTGDPMWVVTKANHERDEIIVGTQDDQNDVNIQIYHSNASWGSLLELSADVSNTDYRAFDIAFEDISGDALIVYENSAAADTTVAYRIWNGNNYSAEQTLATGFAASSAVNWVQLTPRTGADNIMLLLHNSDGDIYAVLWNGTGFDADRNLEASTATTSLTEEHFAFAWEEQSGQGLLIYGESDLTYRTYSPTPPHWSIESTIATGAIDTVRACSEPTSDYIGFIWQDSGNDVNARMWDGSQILGTPPTEDDKTESNGENNGNIDCAWFNSSMALFGFVDFNLLSMDYFNFTKANTWSEADLTAAPTTANFGSGKIEGLRFVGHPTSNEIMIVAVDIAEDISALRWDGSSFASITASPIEASTEVIDAAQESAMFDWYRYDPVPNVTSINPDGTNFELNDEININATVSDNINISTVLANITLPSGVVEQVTLLETPENNYIFNNSFSTTAKSGVYTIKIIVNDTSVHKNVNNTESVTFSVGDIVFPNVTIISPASSSSYNISEKVSISANVTDNKNISAVLANITLPNGSVEQLNLTKQVNNITFNKNFTNTSTNGIYTLRIIANDTSDNTNNTETVTFTAGDVTFPSVINITPAGSNLSLNSEVKISVNVTDDINVSQVFANITLPNGSLEQLRLLNSTNNESIFNATYINTSIIGRYNITITANDTSGNINDSETSFFTIGDTTSPAINLGVPVDGFNTSNSTLAFNFTAIDASATINCSLIIGSITNKTNTSVQTGVNTSFAVNNFNGGSYNWNVSCIDPSENQNTSATWSFTVDLTNVTFISLTTSPSSVEELDPGVNVTAIANVTDNRTAVNTVILQRKLTNVTTFTNLTMALNTSDNLYYATFNATDNGTYILRLFGNDTVGHESLSNTINISVSTDRTWKRIPSTFSPVTGNLNANVTLGNLTVNNTGDVTLNFTITSDSTFTTYNESKNFTLSAGVTKTLMVNDSYNVSGIKTVLLNITAAVNASPTSQITTGTLVIAAGQPVLVATFTTPSENTLSVTQGQTGVEFEAKLENIGEGNASNVSFFFTIPSDWTLTSGSFITNYTELISGDTETKIIRVTINSDASVGDKAVIVNTTGSNESGFDLGDLNLTFSDLITVTVGSSEQLGGGGTSSAGGAAGAAAGGASGGGAGGGGAAGGAVRKVTIGTGETIYTTEVLEILRGTAQEIPLTVTNQYENAYLENISIEVQGFMSQYITIEPIVEANKLVHVETKSFMLNTSLDPQLVILEGMEHHYIKLDRIEAGGVTLTFSSNPTILHLNIGETGRIDLDRDGTDNVAITLKDLIKNDAYIDIHRLGPPEPGRIYFAEARNYSLKVFAPTYLQKQLKNLSVKISARIVAVNPNLAGFSWKPLTEFRTLVFKLSEASIEQAEEALREARRSLDEMVNAGFPTTRVEGLIGEAEGAFGAGNYEIVVELAEDLEGIKKNAFDADRLIKEIQQDIEKARSRWLKVPQTELSLDLALKAFAREDFGTALERAKDAQLTLILETRGKVNIIWFVSRYWWAIILGAMLLSLVSFLAYKKLIILIIGQRLKNLAKEEGSINALMEEAQYKHLQEQSMTAEEYHRSMAQYEARLNKIEQITVKLRNKRIGILKTEQEIENLEREERDVLELIKKAQIDYFNKGKLTRQKFMRIYKSDKSRLAEVQEEKELAKDKLEREKITKEYKFLRKVNDVYLKIESLFKFKKKEGDRKETKNGTEKKKEIGKKKEEGAAKKEALKSKEIRKKKDGKDAKKEVWQKKEVGKKKEEGYEKEKKDWKKEEKKIKKPLVKRASDVPQDEVLATVRSGEGKKGKQGGQPDRKVAGEAKKQVPRKQAAGRKTGKKKERSRTPKSRTPKQGKAPKRKAIKKPTAKSSKKSRSKLVTKSKAKISKQKEKRIKKPAEQEQELIQNIAEGTEFSGSGEDAALGLGSVSNTSQLFGFIENQDSGSGESSAGMPGLAEFFELVENNKDKENNKITIPNLAEFFEIMEKSDGRLEQQDYDLSNIAQFFALRDNLSNKDYKKQDFEMPNLEGFFNLIEKREEGIKPDLPNLFDFFEMIEKANSKSKTENGKR